MNRKIYILPELNGAVIDENNRLFYFDNFSGELNKIDQIVLSQLKSLKPNVQELESSFIDRWEISPLFHKPGENELMKLWMPLLTDKISKYLSNNITKNLSRVLQTMDIDLSDQYKLGIATLVFYDIQKNAEVLPFLYRELFCKILPKDFNSTSPLAFIPKSFSVLAEFYHDLNNNNKALAMADALLKKEMPFDMLDWAKIDKQLIENGFYFNISAAIRFRSKSLLDYTFQQLGIWTIDERVGSFLDYNDSCSDKFAHQIKERYNIIIEDSSGLFRFSFPSFSKRVLKTDLGTFNNSRSAILAIEKDYDVFEAFDLILNDFGPYSARSEKELMYFLLSEIEASAGFRSINAEISYPVFRGWYSSRILPRSPFVHYRLDKLEDLSDVLYTYNLRSRLNSELSTIWLKSTIEYYTGAKNVEKSLFVLVRELYKQLKKSQGNYFLYPHLILAKLKIAVLGSLRPFKTSNAFVEDCVNEIKKFEKANNEQNWYYFDSTEIIASVFNAVEKKGPAVYDFLGVGYLKEMGILPDKLDITKSDDDGGSPSSKG